jgi:hypothetical protein
MRLGATDAHYYKGELTIAAELPRLHRLIVNSPFDESECEPRIEDSLDDFLDVADLQCETHPWQCRERPKDAAGS